MRKHQNFRERRGEEQVQSINTWQCIRSERGGESGVPHQSGSRFSSAYCVEPLQPPGKGKRGLKIKGPIDVLYRRTLPLALVTKSTFNLYVWMFSALKQCLCGMNN